MVPVVSSDREQPTEDGRFQLTVEHSVALGMPFQSECLNCVAINLRELKPGQVVRIYYTSCAIFDIENTKSVRDTVGGFLQSDERMLKIMDMTLVSPYTPERGMISLDQTVYHEQNMNSKLSGAAAQIVIAISKKALTLTNDGQTMPMSALLKRRQMQVSQL